MSRLVGALALVIPLALHATGCKHKDYYDRDTVTPVQADPSLGVSIDVTGKIAVKPGNGDLHAPLRIRNDRTEAIRIVESRCEVELTNGNRCHSRDDDTVWIPPGATRELEILFGERSAPVTGTSFRIYLWIERPGASGLLEFVPPLVVKGGSDAFAYPPRPFQRDPQTGKPVQDEFPPVSPRTAPDAGAPASAPSHPCRKCGEPKPDDATFCPHCGEK